MEKGEIEQKIAELEALMLSPDFWTNKDQAQATIKEIQKLKGWAEGGAEGYDRGDAVLTIFSGAGGDDSEDFSAMLLKMYFKYFDKKGWGYSILHQNQNDNGGFRNVTVEVLGKLVYGTLKNESGVHRLPRLYCVVR
jgi:peptide chain release factor 2